ncbi:MAG: alpha/beta fold hydrolase [Rhodobacterales bacterium]|nr:alpha/beta fold hydrolase [Rhodobacterales bacterium]
MLKLITGRVSNGAASVVYHAGGAGPAVCLLPSRGRGAGDLRALAAALVERGFRVLLPEPRGIGGSTGPYDGADFHDLAADVAAVIAAETAEAERIIVAGHAFGHFIARTLAADIPDRLRGLVFLAAGGATWADALTRATDLLGQPGVPRADRLAALRLAFFAPGNDPEPWLDGWHADVAAGQSAARHRTDRETWWHGGTAPILDVIGRQDPFRAPDHHQDYAREFGGRVTLRFIDGASHALPDERPTEAADAIAAWARALG